MTTTLNLKPRDIRLARWQPVLAVLTNMGCTARLGEEAKTITIDDAITLGVDEAWEMFIGSIPEEQGGVA